MGGGAGGGEFGEALVDAEVPVEVTGFVGFTFGGGEEAAAAGGALVRLVGVECPEELWAESLESGVMGSAEKMRRGGW